MARDAHNDRMRPVTDGPGQIPATPSCPDLVGAGPQWDDLKRAILQLARSDTSLLLTGEPGTGRHLVARHIHFRSTRADLPFVPVDCPSHGADDRSAQLFGRASGSTPATLGFLGAAHGGTLLLENVTRLHPDLLDRVLDSVASGLRLADGAAAPEPLSVRLMATGPPDFDALAAAEDGLRRLRRDDRLHLVALRERPQDIVPLARHFLRQVARQEADRPRHLSAEARKALVAHDWPGNVGELATAIELAHHRSLGDTIQPHDLAPPIGGAPDRGAGIPGP